MNYLTEKLKSFTLGLVALLFVVAVSLSSCGGSSSHSADEDAQDQVEATEEHPSDEAVEEEHPSSDEAEAPADSTATEEEHPAGEHPSGE